MDAMTRSVVRRLLAIARELDGVRVDTAHMNPRADEDVIMGLYQAEARVVDAARAISPLAAEYWRRG